MVIVQARQAEGIHSLELIPGPHKDLKIRALGSGICGAVSLFVCSLTCVVVARCVAGLRLYIFLRVPSWFARGPLYSHGTSG
jgi:hypothetical protein